MSTIPEGRISSKPFQEPNHENARSLAAVFEKLNSYNSLIGSPVVECTWPSNETLSFCDALREAGHASEAENFEKSLGAANAQREMSCHPVIAVFGELNAGKSSVVTSFLSDTGRDRLPIGEGDDTGTHRFVYWVPSSWLQDESRRRVFYDLLETAHGAAREFLSDDPDQAAVQYRSGRDHPDVIEIPLIAADPALDELGAAFLDCPDVQTRDRGAAEFTHENRRLAFVAKAARLCSALLLVWERSKVRDRLFTEMISIVRARMTNVPLYLLINKIRPERGQPTRTRNDPNIDGAMKEFGCAACYGAFDFDIGPRLDEPGWKELTPPSLVPVGDLAVRLPTFFALGPEAAANQPDVVAEDRFLVNLPKTLDAAELQRQKLADHLTEVGSVIKHGVRQILDWTDRRKSRAGEIHNGLREFCQELFRDPVSQEPLQLATPEFIEAWQASFLRTGPWYLSTGLTIHSGLHNAVASTKNVFAGFFGWFKSLGERAKDLKEDVSSKLAEIGIPRGRMDDADSLAHEMRERRWVPAHQTHDDLKRAWATIVRANRENPLTMDAVAFDRMTKDVWDNLSFWQSIRLMALGVLSIFSILLAFAGAVFAAIDGGATFLASYSLTAALVAKIPALATIGVATAGVAGAAFAGYMEGIMNLNTMPYITQLFSFACDCFGVPRRIDGGPITVCFGKSVRKEFALIDKILRESPTLKVECKLDELALWREAPALQRYREVAGNE